MFLNLMKVITPNGVMPRNTIFDRNANITILILSLTLLFASTNAFSITLSDDDLANAIRSLHAKLGIDIDFNDKLVQEIEQIISVDNIPEKYVMEIEYFSYYLAIAYAHVGEPAKALKQYQLYIDKYGDSGKFYRSSTNNISVIKKEYPNLLTEMEANKFVTEYKLKLQKAIKNKNVDNIYRNAMELAYFYNNRNQYIETINLVATINADMRANKMNAISEYDNLLYHAFIHLLLDATYYFDLQFARSKQYNSDKAKILKRKIYYAFTPFMSEEEKLENLENMYVKVGNTILNEEQIIILISQDLMRWKSIIIADKWLMDMPFCTSIMTIYADNNMIDRICNEIGMKYGNHEYVNAMDQLSQVIQIYKINGNFYGGIQLVDKYIYRFLTVANSNAYFKLKSKEQQEIKRSLQKLAAYREDQSILLIIDLYTQLERDETLSTLDDDKVYQFIKAINMQEPFPSISVPENIKYGRSKISTEDALQCISGELDRWKYLAKQLPAMLSMRIIDLAGSR